MKKQILNLGKALNKAEQKSINGGGNDECIGMACPPNMHCCEGICMYFDQVCYPISKGGDK